MILIFAKIFSVFSISFIGYTANKFNWLPSESTKYLSRLLVNITNPCLILYSMSQQDLTEATLKSVLQAAGLMLLALVIGSALSFFVVKRMRVPLEDRGVYQMLLVLANSGYMGYPLTLAIFGEHGLFLMIICNLIVILYTYSAGVIMLISGKDGSVAIKNMMKSIISIPVITSMLGVLIFTSGIQFPSLLENFLDTVGAITIPLSMIIIGIQLAESKTKEVLNNKHIFETLFFKLIVIPATLFVILIWIPVSPFVFCIVIFAMAMPSAAIVPVLSDLYDTNSKLAAQVVFITTLFSLITIPVYAILLTSYLGV